MIGIIGAMPEEISGLKNIMTNKEEIAIGGFTFYKGVIHEKQVVCAVSGIGKVFSALTAQTMILNFNPSVIINTGIAGGLTDELDILDIAIGESAVQYDVDTTAFGDPLGYISDLKQINLNCDKKVCDIISDCANELNLKSKKCIIATGDRFVADVEFKNFLREQFKASACEMEGGSIGQVCVWAGVPFGIIRAISDSKSGNEMDYMTFKIKASEISTRITELFIKKYF